MEELEVLTLDQLLEEMLQLFQQLHQPVEAVAEDIKRLILKMEDLVVEEVTLINLMVEVVQVELETLLL